ncbi:cell division control protein Cdc15 [Schizosaccharomyces cryophilus OY26]|uniref:Cell division control protein Cdc15 n=1 Tax=Schizosaccharomyces cryophilus (strain OY26 / ATCC MYA-4695 / CBS 11777 / NBRC 106824 / NRRL Y48691) TaxID=653667 RepID=S9XB22_SCHCR|nr:cell division control protein Cdc15 [Schizosaccharomyces cryophilus OY26]EPY50941.1 cell division control protein Cdc15 [Schizosaccharomyces cryophilus OY26]
MADIAVNENEVAPYITKSPTKFRENFWGYEDAGMDALMSRTRNSLSTLEVINRFYSRRAAIEREYALKLNELVSETPKLAEYGTTYQNMESLKTETSNMSQAHNEVSGQIEKELLEKVNTYISQTQQQKSLATDAIEELYQQKTALEIDLSEKYDAYEYSANKLNSYLKLASKYSGRELDKHNLKVRQAALTVQRTEKEYRETNSLLRTVTQDWVDRWTEICDAFQHIEEYRLEFLKTNMWSYANIISTACVRDDEACERIRLTLEKTNVANDITLLIQKESTGTNVPSLPEEHNYFKENGIQVDLNQIASKAPSLYRASSRAGSSALLSASPHMSSPRIKKSDSFSSELASPPTSPFSGKMQPMSFEQSLSPEMTFSVPELRNDSQRNSEFKESPSVPSLTTVPTQTTEVETNKFELGEPSSPLIVPTKPIEPVVEDRSSKNDLDDAILGQDFPPPSFNSRVSRPSFSRHGQGSQSSMGSIKRKSIMERMGRPTSPFVGSTFSSMRSRSNSPIKDSLKEPVSPAIGSSHSDEMDEIDPRANVVLNVGPNMLKVGDVPEQPKGTEDKSSDPIADAMAHLSMSVRRRQSTSTAGDNTATAKPASSSNRLSMLGSGSHNQSSTEVDGLAKRSSLGAPPAAHTSAQMQRMSNSFANQTKRVFGEKRGDVPLKDSLRHSRSNLSRSPSPMLSRRSSAIRSGVPERSSSSLSMRQQEVNPVSRSRGQSLSGQTSRPASSLSNRPPSQLSLQRSVSPNPLGHHRKSSSIMNMQRSTSPNPVNRSSANFSHSRPSSGMDMRYSSLGGRSSRQLLERTPTGRSRSPASSIRSGYSKAEPRASFTAEGEPILGYVIALYDYKAQIPEEISFQKGDTLMVLRTQEDGWWDGEVINIMNPKRGLFPSNFVQTV